MMIDIISDTVTRPTKEMLEYMMGAKLGDDVFQQDPSVNALQEKVSKMFGMEAALFCPSGTMTNQIAIKVHTSPLDEVICHEYSHIYQYEVGGYAFNSGVAINLLNGPFGKITADQIRSAVKEDYDWLPKSTLVVIENSNNKGGGSYYTLKELQTIKKACAENKLKTHLDGARIFNVLVETGENPKDYGKLFDSISICLSKGLGAPVGSLLIGDKEFIYKARRLRKVMGGGMRQAGILAAAGIYALDHHVERLKEDNDRAKIIGSCLEKQSYVASVRPVQTNIIIFDLKAPWTTEKFLQILSENNIQATAFGIMSIRFVTHLDFTEEMLDKLVRILENIS
jgi:threonine aldolase